MALNELAHPSTAFARRVRCACASVLRGVCVYFYAQWCLWVFVRVGVGAKENETYLRGVQQGNSNRGAKE